MAFLGSIATICAVFTGLYILWTSMEVGIGAKIITGVQGRYFIPIIPLGIVILSNSILQKNKTIKTFMEKILTNSYLVPLMALVITLVTVFERYWV